MREYFEYLRERVRLLASFDEIPSMADFRAICKALFEAVDYVEGKYLTIHGDKSSNEGKEEG